MKSPFSDSDAVLRQEPSRIEFRGEQFDVIHFFYECPDTQLRFTTDELDWKNISQVYDPYRERHYIPSPEEIKKIRKSYRLSTENMSDILGLDPGQWRHFEEGEVPSVSNARLISAISDPDVFSRVLEESRTSIGEEEYRNVKELLIFGS